MRWAGALAASALLLAPCWWQPRIQAGDLSSHLYNAWLAQRIEAGGLDGLTLVPQHTNILFDLILGALLRLCGAQWAQRIAVSLAVLVFFWGAYAFVARVSGARPKHLLPVLAMLAYGWVFHMGFFNFYLSLGLACWALALAWDLRPPGLAAAAALLLPAYAAHALPVAWAAGLLAYAGLARRIDGRRRVWLAAGAVLLLAAGHAAVALLLPSAWTPRQASLAGSFGVDQLWVYDRKYQLAEIGLLLLWVSLFLRLRRAGGRQLLESIPLQLVFIGVAAVLILPGGVLLPGYRHALAYIPERMSLPLALSACALLGAAPPRRFERWGLAAVALLYFAFLFRDDRALNRFEDRLDAAVAQLPPGQRVVSPVLDPQLRIDAATHMIDRACLGRCYSYANYEASTAQFRVRATAPNRFVLDDYGDSWDLQNGRYRVRERDLPLYRIVPDGAGQMQVQGLRAGELCSAVDWDLLRDRAARP